MPLEPGEISRLHLVRLTITGGEPITHTHARARRHLVLLRIDIELADHRPNYKRDPHRVGAILPCQATKGVPPLHLQFGLEGHLER